VNARLSFRYLPERIRPVALGLLVVLGLILPGPLVAQDSPGPEKNYYVYACAESEDEVALIRFGPGGTQVVKTITVGSFPAEIEGPHGLNVSPDGRHWFVTLAHGFPYGSVHKYETGSDEWVADATLGLFPATLDISASTGLMYVVNFNLHGKMEPSSISVVETSTMIEVARYPSGVMPHGSRLSPDGKKHYFVNMMDDNLVEVDALKFEQARSMKFPGGMATMSDGGMDHSSMDHSGGGHMEPTIQPTWVTRPTVNNKVYVAGNKSNTIFEVDLADWKITRRFEDTAAGPYNLDVTPDGNILLATYKKSQAVGFWDLQTGKELAKVKTSRSVPHGVVISKDGLYAFVTIEGKGAEPGTVEVYHIATQRRVGLAEIGKQAGGIVFWKAE